MQTKLSIIIPYYETYDYTIKLLNKLVPQLNDKTEVILIDDSYDLRLDNYKKQITIIHSKKRQGLSKARNIGISKSKGEYIAFIDSDDIVSDDYVDVLLKAIDEHKEDVIVFDWQDLNNGNIIRHPDNYAVWKAIYKKEITPLFNEEMFYNEDVEFQAKLNNVKPSKFYLDKVLYFYNSNRIGSLMWEKWRKNMIKCEVIKDFTLARFDELENIKRKGADVYGALKVGDTFECEKEMAEYLTGNNPIKEVVVKILEVEPEKETELVTEEAEETIEEVIEPIEDEEVQEEISTEIEELIEEPKKEKKSNKKK